MSASLKEMIKGNTVEFLHYKDGDLWYSLSYGEPVDDKRQELVFPVPVSDVGTATMLNKDNALYFMRYIRKFLKEIEQTG